MRPSNNLENSMSFRHILKNSGFIINFLSQDLQKLFTFRLVLEGKAESWRLEFLEKLLAVCFMICRRPPPGHWIEEL